MATKQAQLESILFLAGDSGVEENNLLQLLKATPHELDTLTTTLAARLENEKENGLCLIKINNIFKLTTSPECSDIVSQYFDKDITKSLSQSALEILSIIAYRQPITRIEIDEIRGVNSSGALQTLVWRGLVEINGKKDVVGHPNIYITTDYFLQYFGYQSLTDLPIIEKFSDNINEDGQIDLFGSKGKADNQIIKENSNLD